MARAQATLTDPRLAEFVAQLDEINALADRSPGFVWRLQTDAGNATDIKVSDDPRLIVNMSVWESLDALTAYVYKSGHLRVLSRRKEWFERLDTPSIALWWIPGLGRAPRRRPQNRAGLRGICPRVTVRSGRGEGCPLGGTHTPTGGRF